MSIMEHHYGVPTEEELARLVGSATPHFALQIRDRVVAFRDALPDDDARRPGLDVQVAHLERLAISGVDSGDEPADLPARPSLEGLH